MRHPIPTSTYTKHTGTPGDDKARGQYLTLALPSNKTTHKLDHVTVTENAYEQSIWLDVSWTHPRTLKKTGAIARAGSIMLPNDISLIPRMNHGKTQKESQGVRWVSRMNPLPPDGKKFKCYTIRVRAPTPPARKLPSFFPWFQMRE